MHWPTSALVRTCSAWSSTRPATASRRRPSLEQLIKEFIAQHEWMSYDADLKGDAYEGLIEKTAQEGARGAGQYFTPRALINRHRRCDAAGPDDRICDPACGTGGFFLGAYRSIVERFPHLEPDQVAHLRSGAFNGGRSPTYRLGCAP